MWEEREISRREVLRRLGIGGAAVALPTLLAACGGSPKPKGTASASGDAGGRGTDAEIDHVTWALTHAVPALDVATSFGAPTIAALSLGLEGLVGVDDDLRLTPQLAEKWSNPDPLRYVYQLRSGVTFWDGSPLTADDVVSSLRRHIDPAVTSQLGTYYTNVASIKKTGPSEVTVRMKRPDPLFQYIPVLSYITPKALNEKLGKRLGVAGSKINTMGTGAFRITKFGPDTGLSLERYDGYWGDKPRVRTATVKVISNARTLLLARRAGEIDGTFELAAEQAKDWRRLRDTAVEQAPGMRSIFLSFDLSQEPWNDVHVRRAVVLASDRGGYVNAFLGGMGRAASSIVPPEMWANLAKQPEVDRIYSGLRKYPYDVEAAKRELAQSAHPKGFSADIVFPDNEPAIGRALVSLGESLRPLGIRLRVRETTSAKWIGTIYAHEDLGLQVLPLSPAYVDPANYLVATLPSEKAAPNGLNIANFKNQRVDQLLREQGKVTDPKQRAAAIAEILTIIGDELPYLPLWWQGSSMAVADRYAYEGFNSLYYMQNWLGKLRLRA